MLINFACSEALSSRGRCYEEGWAIAITLSMGSGVLNHGPVEVFAAGEEIGFRRVRLIGILYKFNSRPSFARGSVVQHGC